MSESASPHDASSKASRSRKSAAKKPRKSHSAAPDTGAQTQSAPAPQAQTAAIEVEVHSLHLTAVDKASMIATAAYYRAEQRRFAGGHEMEDWLAAEAEIEALVRSQRAV